MFKELLVEFCRALREEIGDEEYAEVLALNAQETDPNVCHSHDYCDANMVMLATVQRVYGLDEESAISVMIGAIVGPAIDAQPDDIGRTVNAVWEYFATCGKTAK